MNKEIVICGISRTPFGSFNGQLSKISAPQLAAHAISGLFSGLEIDQAVVDEVILGNVLSAGIGQAPARQASINANLSNKVECLTINKMCGSGLKAVMLGAQSIYSNDSNIAIVGGMENMSLAPHYVKNVRKGIRLGNTELIDGMIYDGLLDAYKKIHMGVCAEMCAEKYNLSKSEQDDYAIRSYEKSQKANQDGIFDNEICPITINQKGKKITIRNDEEPFRFDLDKIEHLNTVFKKDGTITAGNASTINDGASVCLITDFENAKKLKLRPLAKIIDYCSVALEPEWFTIAPIKAIEKILKRTNLDINTIDLFEINEAFSIVALVAIKELGLNSEKVNINGGAVSIGHPIGASGSRILNTLVNSLRNHDKKYGLASICIGGGEASAMLIERI